MALSQRVKTQSAPNPSNRITKCSVPASLTFCSPSQRHCLLACQCMVSNGCRIRPLAGTILACSWTSLFIF